MDNIDYGEVFGVQTGAKEQGAAEPAQDEETSQGAKEQTDAASAANDKDAGKEAPGEAEDSRDAETEAADKTADTGKQSDELNHAYAAARRKAEAGRDEQVQAAREEAEKYISKSIKALGIEDPYTGKTIETREEYEAYQKRIEADKKTRLIERTGLSEEEFNELVEDLPEVKAAKEARARAEDAENAAMNTRIKADIEEDVRKIAEIDPSIKTVDDVLKKPKWAELYARVNTGLTLFDAYKLTYFEELSSGAAAKARQQERNLASGKDHLSATGTRGTGTLPVPAEVREMYKELNPGITDAEISAHYNRNHKET